MKFLFFKHENRCKDIYYDLYPETYLGEYIEECLY